MPPAAKDLLDVVVPPVNCGGVDASLVTVLDTGDSNPLQRMTFVHFYMTAAVAMVESHEASKKKSNPPAGCTVPEPRAAA